MTTNDPCTLVIVAVSDDLINNVGDIMIDIKHILGTAYIETTDVLNIIKINRHICAEEKDIVSDRLNKVWSGNIVPIYIEDTIGVFEEKANRNPNYLNAML